MKISGVTLYSYRYSWAQRAKAAGYPQRYAQQALGHASKGVTEAYAAEAQFVLPSLEEFELKNAQDRVIRVDFPRATPGEAVEAPGPAEVETPVIPSVTATNKTSQASVVGSER